MVIISNHKYNVVNAVLLKVLPPNCTRPGTTRNGYIIQPEHNPPGSKCHMRTQVLIINLSTTQALNATQLAFSLTLIATPVAEFKEFERRFKFKPSLNMVGST